MAASGGWGVRGRWGSFAGRWSGLRCVFEGKFEGCKGEMCLKVEAGRGGEGVSRAVKKQVCG